MSEAGKVVLPVGIDERQRSRQRLGRLVMIEHDHVEAEPFGLSERLVADRPAIDRDDELGAFCREARNRLGVRAIAFGHPVGNMHDRLAAAGGEKFGQERGAAGAVDVVVAEDRDPFAALDRAPEAIRRRFHVAHAIRVRHQVAQGRIEIALDRLRLDAAPREHPRDQLVLTADLRDRQGARLARAVQAGAPRPAEGRALDIEKIADGCHGLLALALPAPARGRGANPSPAYGRRRREASDEGGRAAFSACLAYAANRRAATPPKNTMPDSAVIQKLVGQSV